MLTINRALAASQVQHVFFEAFSICWVATSTRKQTEHVSRNYCFES